MNLECLHNDDHNVQFLWNIHSHLFEKQIISSQNWPPLVVIVTVILLSNKDGEYTYRNNLFYRPEHNLSCIHIGKIPQYLYIYEHNTVRHLSIRLYLKIREHEKNILTWYQCVNALKMNAYVCYGKNILMR